ncbi:MAG: hypothetical protein K8I82_25830 [Anaerolineae bacterium]|nr:hypothetical protein [Anaerolineae bacterium]
MEHRSTSEWLAEGKILHVVQRGSSTRDEVDAIFGPVIELIKNWPAEQQVLLLWDSSHLSHMNWSPHIRRRIFDLLEAFPPAIHGRFAAVVKKSPVTQIIRVFIEYELNRRYKGREHRLFYTTEAALVWLEELL